MEYVYAALLLQETGSEINEQNLSATLETAGADVETSRIKAVVAALEDVDIAATQAAAMDSGSDALELEGDVEEADDEDADGEGSLGALFDADDEGAIADEDESVEGADRPSDLDGEAADPRDEPEA